jgi:hypothetical protein
LFDSVPWYFFTAGIPNFGGKMTEVCVCGAELFEVGISPLPGFAHDHDVVSLSEGVTVVCAGLKDNLRVFCEGLVAR